MAGSAFYISEVVFGSDGYVAVTNGSSETADPDGLFLCQFPSYPPLPAGPIEPGKSVHVAASDIGELSGDSGEAALYLRPDWSDPEAIAGYMQWGSAGHKRETPAVEAGVWERDAFVDASGAASLRAVGPGVNTVRGWSTV